MPPAALSSLSGLALVSAPVAAAVLPGGDAAPVQMVLLWYAIVGIMGLLSAASTAVSVLDYLNRRKEKDAAGKMGGYVTHGTLLEELRAVYTKMGDEDKQTKEHISEVLKELKAEVAKIQTGLVSVHSRHERLEGQLNPIQTAPQTRRRPLP